MVQNTHIEDKEVADADVDADAVEAADDTKERGICGISSSWIEIIKRTSDGRSCCQQGLVCELAKSFV